MYKLLSQIITRNCDHTLSFSCDSLMPFPMLTFFLFAMHNYNERATLMKAKGGNWYQIGLYPLALLEINMVVTNYCNEMIRK